MTVYLSHPYRSLLTTIEYTERHVHNNNRCWGDSGANDFTENGNTAWQLTSGVGAWTAGTWVQIYSGTLLSGVEFDLGKMLVRSVQRLADLYLVEFVAGAGAVGAATAAGSFYYEQSSAVGTLPHSRKLSPRILGSINMWARAYCTNAAASTIDFVLEGHTYPGIHTITS